MGGKRHGEIEISVHSAPLRSRGDQEQNDSSLLFGSSPLLGRSPQWGWCEARKREAPGGSRWLQAEISEKYSRGLEANTCSLVDKQGSVV